MGLSVEYGSIILEYSVRNIDVLNMFIAPLPMRSHVGLGLGCRCIILGDGIMNMRIPGIVIVHVHR